MKKGKWQQDTDNHISEYCSEYITSKYFNLTINKDILNLFKNFSEENSGDCDVYEFGVYTGGTLRDTISQLKSNKIKFNHVYGFDSFEGLPQETNNMIIEGDHWKVGAFSACDALKIWDWNILHKQILQTIGHEEDTTLIKGYFSESLTQKLVMTHNFRPALFVHIDVDLYISTIQVLEWMVKNKLLIKNTIIRYDDILKVPENTGELLAHSQICEKYNIKYSRIDKHYFIINSL